MAQDKGNKTFGAAVAQVEDDLAAGPDVDRIRHVSREGWLETFDSRRLNFSYRKQRSDGRPSTFFRLETPGREDA